MAITRYHSWTSSCQLGHQAPIHHSGPTGGRGRRSDQRGLGVSRERQERLAALREEKNGSERRNRRTFFIFSFLHSRLSLSLFFTPHFPFSSSCQTLLVDSGREAVHHRHQSVIYRVSIGGGGGGMESLVLRPAAFAVVVMGY